MALPLGKELGVAIQAYTPWAGQPRLLAQTRKHVTPPAPWERSPKRGEGGLAGRRDDHGGTMLGSPGLSCANVYA
jgi:hypothetical protein